MKVIFLSLAYLAFTLSACSTAHLPVGTATVAAAPVVHVDATLLKQQRDDACRSIAGNEISDPTRGALAAGMLQADFEAIRSAAQHLQVTATFRDSNQACLEHLAAGVQSKPHAVLQKTWDRSNLLPEDGHLAGLVSNLMSKPAKGEKISNPQLTLYNGEPVTCDYDLMDLAESHGIRVAGESAREAEIRSTFNKYIPPAKNGHKDRIMHGSQANYGAFAQLHAEETVITALFKPEAPLTAFTASGTVFRLESIESVLNYYTCFQIALPGEWNVYADDRSTIPVTSVRLK